MEEIVTILLLFLAIPAQSNVIPNANAILRNKIQNIDQEEIIILPAIDSNVETDLEDEINYRDNIESMEESAEHDVIIENPSDHGEVMHTAENIVFRPLFSYKKVQEKRRRLYGSNSNRRTGSSQNQNNNRRSSIVTSSEPPINYVYSYPYAYPVPAYYYNNRIYYYPYESYT